MVGERGETPKMKQQAYNNGFNDHESRITRLECTIENINATLGRFEKRFDKIDDQLVAIKAESSTQFRWVIGIIVTSFIAPIILKLLHWF